MNCFPWSSSKGYPFVILLFIYYFYNISRGCFIIKDDFWVLSITSLYCHAPLLPSFLGPSLLTFSVKYCVNLLLLPTDLPAEEANVTYAPCD